jgi:hypothetical protein
MLDLMEAWKKYYQEGKKLFKLHGSDSGLISFSRFKDMLNGEIGKTKTKRGVEQTKEGA